VMTKQCSPASSKNLGSVRSIEERGENARIVIAANVVTEGTNHGDSIA
jgi:hypothetical protein